MVDMVLGQATRNGIIIGFTGPIGTNNFPFMSTLDGNEHRIDVAISKYTYAGLFGYAEMLL